MLSEHVLSEDVRKRVEYMEHGKAAGNAALMPQWLALQRKIVGMHCQKVFAVCGSVCYHLMLSDATALLGYKSVSAFYTEVAMLFLCFCCEC